MVAGKKYTVAIVGATGAVGMEMAKVLDDRDFPLAKLVPLASERSFGKDVYLGDRAVAVQVLSPESFQGVDIALFSAGSDVSLEYAPIAAAAGAVVIDNTAAFRMDKDVPLVVPEVNPQHLKDWEERRIIANPNCSTIQMLVALKPLHDKATIERIVVSTYQSVSGAGTEAMEELSQQSVALFSQKDCLKNVFPHRIAFNCIPHIDRFLDDGSTKEEMKMINETRKILGLPDMRVAATTVRVPVFCGHSESVNVEFEEDISPEDAREILSSAAGVEVIDDPNLCKYPMAVDCVGKDAVFVGRIRRDHSVDHGLALWIVSDNLRKGAALNAVQIAELMIKKYI